MKIPIEISARHIHLAKKDFEKLFGKDKNLNKIKDLSQLGEFISKERLKIIKGNKFIDNIGIIGPFRDDSQVEISLTDAYNLKLKPLPKIRVSRDIVDTIKILVRGPKGQLKIPCIIAQRHLHCSEEEAKKLKIKDKQIIKIKISGKRGIIFENVIVRVKPTFCLSFQIDTDEGNAAGIFKKTFGEIVK
jgi:propanediol utilization protein